MIETQEIEIRKAQQTPMLNLTIALRFDSAHVSSENFGIKPGLPFPTKSIAFQVSLVWINEKPERKKRMISGVLTVLLLLGVTTFLDSTNETITSNFSSTLFCPMFHACVEAFRTPNVI